MIKEINQLDFNELVFDITQPLYALPFKGNKPCIVVFYDNYCTSCKNISTILQSIISERDEINIYFININYNRKFASIFGIKSTPSIALITMDCKISIVYGILQKNKIIELINKIIFNKIL